MSIEEKLMNRLQESIKEYISVEDIPDTMSLKILSMEFKPDNRDNESLFCYLITEDNKYLTQKYTITTYKEVKKRIDANGGLEALKKNFVVYEKLLVGNIRKPRLFPTYPSEE